jgi:hypothetical protein
VSAIGTYRTLVYNGYGWVFKEDADRIRGERDRYRQSLELIARLEDEYREAGLPYDLDTGAQMASRRAGDIAREGLGLPPRESAYDPPLGRKERGDG